MHPTNAPHDLSTSPDAEPPTVPPVLRARRLFAVCLAIGLATTASVFAGSMALAQSISSASEVIVVRTMYDGHDGHRSCPGVAEVKAAVGDQVTYCYTLDNPSATALDRVEFADAATGANTSMMPVVAGSVPVAADSSITWAFETRAATALAGPEPTPTSEPTPTPDPTPTPRPTATPAPTVAAAAVVVTPTATPTTIPADPTAILADPAAMPPDPTAIPADPTAIPADLTAIPADPTAIPAAPSAPAPPAASEDTSILDPAAMVEVGSVDGQSATSSTTVQAVDAADAAASTSTLAPSIIERAAAADLDTGRSNRRTLVPIATSSGWRLGNTTAAMVLSVLIAVSTGLVAGVVFWRFARHLQRRRSALYWYERLAVIDDSVLA